MQEDLMKRNTVFLVILLIFGTQTFADENLSELENINIEWQLLNNKTEYTNLNILGFNPLFLYNRNYGLLNEAVSKLQFWNSNLGFKGKSGHLTAFSKSLFQNQPGFGTSSNMKNIIQNNDIQSEQSIYQNSEENNWLGFLLVVAGYSIIWTDAYKNPLKYRYFENVWERQQIEERMYRNIIKNND
jgi:hypothetical protein